MADSEVFQILATKWPIITTTLLSCLMVWLLQGHLKKDPLSKIPLACSELGSRPQRRLAFLGDAKKIYLESYQNFRDKIYKLTTEKDTDVVIVHPRYLDELRDLPEDVLNFSHAVKDLFQTKYTGLRPPKPIIPGVLRRNLTPALPRINSILAHEVDEVLPEEIGPCEEFTSVHLAPKLTRIVAKASGRIFIGPELCRSEGYLEAAMNYTQEFIGALRAVTMLPRWKRIFKGRSLPEVKSLHERRRKAKEFLQPIIHERKKAGEKTGTEKPEDMLQWLLEDGQSKFGPEEDEDIASYELALVISAIHSTTGAGLNAFYTIAAMPELITELREEARAVLKTHGTFTTQAIQDLKKMDSFLRENSRVYPLALNSFGRKVLKTITLSNGQVLPAGCYIEVPAYGAAHDPDVYSNPFEFDSMRSYHAALEGRDRLGAAASFTTTSPSNLAFGYGKHACPGRFFAANLLKMILARAVLEYDISLPEGTKERFPNRGFAFQYIPDGSKELIFKKIAS